MKTLRLVLLLATFAVSLVSVLTSLLASPPVGLSAIQILGLQAVLTIVAALWSLITITHTLEAGNRIGNPCAWVGSVLLAGAVFQLAPPAFGWLVVLCLTYFWWIQAEDALVRQKAQQPPFTTSREIVPRRIS